MAESRARLFSKLAANLNDSGDIVAEGISSDVNFGVTTYDSEGLLPLTGLTSGDQAFIGNKLFISNGSGWYNVGLVNLNPSITSGPDGATYQLDSTNTVSLSLIASDSDGTPILWSYTVSDSAYDLATITNDSDGSFNVTGKSLADILAAGYDSNGGSFDVTFKASDGISFDTDSATFTLTYYVSVYVETSTLLTASQSNWQFEIDNDTMVAYTLDATYGGSGQILKRDVNGNWSPQGLIFSTPNDTSTSWTSYYRMVAISGDTAAIASDLQETSGVWGSVSIWTRSGSTWSLQQKIPNPQNLSTIYFAMGGIALDGDTLAISNGLSFQNGLGSIQIYVRSGSTWSLQQTITQVRNSSNSGLTNMDQGLNLHLEGDTLTFQHAHNSTNGTGGQIIAYTRSGSTWSYHSHIWLGNTTGSTGDYLFQMAFRRKGNEIYQLWPYTTAPVRHWTLSGTTWSGTNISYDTGTNVPRDQWYSGIDFISDTLLAFNTFEAGSTITYIFEYVNSSWEFVNAVSNVGVGNCVRVDSQGVYIGQDGTDKILLYTKI